MTRSSMLLLSLLVGLSAAATCPPKAVFSSFDGMCYYTSNSTDSWGSAVHSCNSLGGNLFVPQNSFANNMFSSLLLEFGSNSSWLGLYSDDKGFWYNYNTQSIESYFRWAPGQPSLNNSCAFTDRDGIWYSQDCSDWKTFVCQISPSSTEAPTTTTPQPTTRPPSKCSGYGVYTTTTSCADGWTFYLPTCSCYKMIPKNLTWHEAEQNCISENKNQRTHLASIHSQDEAAFVNGLVTGKYQKTLIGLQHIGSDWLWSDGTKVDFFNFASQSTNPDTYPCGFLYGYGYYFVTYMGKTQCNTGSNPSVCKYFLYTPQ